MTIKPMKIFGALILMGLLSSANAASISLVPTSAVDGVSAGDIVSFDVVADFSDVPTLGGGFDIVFDSSALAFSSLTNNQVGDPAFGRDPDILDGLLESWAFANFNPLSGILAVGSVSFEVLGGFTSTTVGTSATNGIGGPFVDGNDFISIIPVEYSSVTVTSQIPVPAAVGFLLSGLGALFGFGRRAA